MDPVLDVAPARRRRAVELAAIFGAPLVGLVAVLAAAWAAAHAVSGDDAAACVTRLTTVSLALAVVLIGVNRVARRVAEIVETRTLELLLGWADDWSAAFPARERSLVQCAGERLPMRVRETRNFLEDARRSPGRVMRTACWVFAAFLMCSLAAQLAWHLGDGRAASPFAWVLAACSLGVFLVACADLAHGRLRALIRPWTIRTRWTRAYEPERLATVVPTIPTLLVVGLPFALAVFAATARTAWTVKFAVAAGALTCLDAAWKYRAAAHGSGFEACERFTAPVSRLLARMVIPTWAVCRGLAIVSGAAAMVGLAAYAAAPDNMLASVYWVGELGALLLALHMLLSMIVLDGWRRPKAVRLMSARELLDTHVTEPVAARVESLLVKGRYLAALLYIVAVVGSTA